MELIRINPSDSILSGNPMPVIWYVTPWTNIISSSNIYALISIQAELAPGSNSFIEIYNQKVIPGEDGAIKIDLSSIVHPHLVYLQPKIKATQPMPAPQQFKNFNVSVTLMQNGQLVVTDSHVISAIKAGAGTTSFNAEFYSLSFADSFFNKKKFLAPCLDREAVNETDVFFLFFLKKEGLSSIRAIYTVQYYLNDAPGTITGTLGSTINTPITPEVWAIPAGIIQSGIAAALPEGALVEKYTIGVDDGADNIVIEPISINLNHQGYADSRQLLYRNSLGGLDAIRLYGNADIMAQYNREEIERVLPPSYIMNDAVQAAVGQANEEVPDFKVNTGWMSRQKAERLKDLLLSPQIYEVNNDNLIPVRLTGQKISFYSTGNDLISVALEYSHAIKNKYYSEKKLVTTSCPSVKMFSWKQVGNDSIAVFWAFPFGYALGEVSVQFPGETAQTYRIEGNAGSVVLNIPRPASASGDVNLVLSCYLICNENVTPIVTGPANTPAAQTYKASMPIVVNDDVFNSTIRAVPFVLDGSVLDNDVDPQGAGLEVQAASNVGATSNFKYSIDAQGRITVTLLSATVATSFNNNPYSVRRRDTGTWTTGYFSVNFKPGEQFIYIKMFVRNTSVQNTTTYGDVFFDTFKDAACTQPLVVSSLTVLYKKVERTWVSGGSNNVTETPGQITMLNTSSVRVYNGAIAYNYRGGGSSTTFQIEPSGDYIKIESATTYSG